VKHIFVIPALALCVLGASRPAQAQIYSWNDPNGIMVVSNMPRGGTSQRTLAAAPAMMARVSASTLRNSTYDAIIQQHSTLQGIRSDLDRAVIQVESAFNPKALSPKGAMGLMQLMPQTAARFGVLDAFNPAENIRAGVSYLKQLLIRYENNEQLALAAYNAGPLAVDRHGSKVPPYKETQDYVKRINALRGATPGTPGLRIYKSVEIVDGVEVVRYSNVKPANTTYQEVRR
jgi:soluble lytic murein transglycosylase-like protein